jgi:hypothetical protein
MTTPNWNTRSLDTSLALRTAAARKPTVLFRCTHNAGRSQMALGFFTTIAGDTAVDWSGGSEPADEINTHREWS